jgi:hypothetical protein
MKIERRIWDIVLTWLFYLLIAQDQVKSSKAPWLKEIWVSLKDGLMNCNSEKNFCLNAGVLLRSCTKIVKPCTLNFHHLAWGSLLMVVIIHHKPSTLYIEMVTNRNLEVITDNFYKFWWIIIFSRDVPERIKMRIKLSKRHET